MCLQKLQFALAYDEAAGEYYGVGYKALDANAKIGKVWKQARGWGTSKLYNNSEYASYGGHTPISLKKNRKGEKPSAKAYYPGFHIFLRKSDAEKYGRGNGVYRVFYKNVLAYGNNDNGEYLKNNRIATGPCVVAEYMRVIEKL